MTTLKVHTIESAPEASKSLLETLKSIRNDSWTSRSLAGSPGLLNAYQTLHELFVASSFEEELTVVWQTINVEHECHYCVPAHTAIAGMMKVDNDITEALRNRTPLANSKLETLRNMTLSMVRNRGNVSQEDLTAFYAAGYGEQQVLDIILGLSQK
jgi:alkylhydroperoxidase family enzyme